MSRHPVELTDPISGEVILTHIEIPDTVEELEAAYGVQRIYCIIIDGIKRKAVDALRNKLSRSSGTEQAVPNYAEFLSSHNRIDLSSPSSKVDSMLDDMELE